MKNHLKRIAAPKTWLIDRKKTKFISRPNPGAHSLDMGLPLGVIFRDNLQLAKTMNEVKKLLNHNEILVDGRPLQDYRSIVGLFDVITVSRLKKFYRVELDSKGRLTLSELPEAQSSLKTCKVVGKRLLKKGQVQLSLHDGKTLLGEKSINVGDSITLELPSLKVKNTLCLKNGAKVLLIAGKHSGIVGDLEQVTDDVAVCLVAKQRIETTKNNLFVVG